MVVIHATPGGIKVIAPREEASINTARLLPTLAPSPAAILYYLVMIAMRYRPWRQTNQSSRPVHQVARYRHRHRAAVQIAPRITTVDDRPKLTHGATTLLRAHTATPPLRNPALQGH